MAGYWLDVSPNRGSELTLGGACHGSGTPTEPLRSGICECGAPKGDHVLRFSRISLKRVANGHVLEVKCHI